jgi:hypothetical protein
LPNDKVWTSIGRIDDALSAASLANIVRASGEVFTVLTPPAFSMWLDRPRMRRRMASDSLSDCARLIATDRPNRAAHDK